MRPHVAPGDTISARAFIACREAYRLALELDACPWRSCRRRRTQDGEVVLERPRRAVAWRLGWQIEQSHDPYARHAHDPVPSRRKGLVDLDANRKTWEDA